MGCSGSIIVLDLSTLAIVRTVKIPATRSDNKQDRHRFSAATRSVAPVVMVNDNFLINFARAFAKQFLFLRVF